MSERSEHSPEISSSNAELGVEAESRLAELRRSPERDPSAQAGERAEQAREAIKHHTEAETNRPDKTETETAVRPTRRPTAVLDHHLNYAQTLASLQRTMQPVSRSFSKIIHTPAVEATSEALEKTVARPSVMAGSIWTALIIGCIFYFTARYYGYALSGSELLFSFVVGALLGILAEGAWRLLRRR